MAWITEERWVPNGQYCSDQNGKCEFLGRFGKCKYHKVRLSYDRKHRAWDKYDFCDWINSNLGKETRTYLEDTVCEPFEWKG